jgi:hypothetical protein
MIAAQWCVQWAGGWVALEHGTRERDRAGWLPRVDRTGCTYARARLGHDRAGSSASCQKSSTVRQRRPPNLHTYSCTFILSVYQWRHTYVHMHVSFLEYMRVRITWVLRVECGVHAKLANVQKATWHASCMRDRYGATINHGQHMSFQVFKLRLAPYPSVVNIYIQMHTRVCRHAYVKSGTEYCTCARTCMYVVLRRRCLRAYVYDFG